MKEKELLVLKNSECLAGTFHVIILLFFPMETLTGNNSLRRIPIKNRSVVKISVKTCLSSYYEQNRLCFRSFNKLYNGGFYLYVYLTQLFPEPSISSGQIHVNVIVYFNI